MLSYLLKWCKKIDILLDDNVYDEDTILMLREVYNKVEDKIMTSLTILMRTHK